jgi:hypothetical protein
MPLSASHITRNPLEKFNGIALRAAVSGFLVSVALMSAWWELGRLLPANAHLQSSFEAVCLLLWPSAILMLGAQTTQGAVALFLLSASLNAGYFVFAVSLLALGIEKLRAHSQVLAPVTVTARNASRPASERLRSPRPAA